jgi:hypothetical protein
MAFVVVLDALPDLGVLAPERGEQTAHFLATGRFDSGAAPELATAETGG